MTIAIALYLLIGIAYAAAELHLWPLEEETKSPPLAVVVVPLWALLWPLMTLVVFGALVVLAYHKKRLRKAQERLDRALAEQARREAIAFSLAEHGRRARQLQAAQTDAFRRFSENMASASKLPRGRDGGEL